MSDPFKPYAEQHANADGAGDSRPTAIQIVQANDLVDKWVGKVALVTGGTSGIGVETVRALHATGADVYFTARDAEKGQATKEDIAGRSGGKGRLEVVDMNMDSLESVRKAAKDFLSRAKTLHVLVNNAGIMAPPYKKTVDGFESQFAVNHLAHYLLTNLLLPTLESSSTPELNSRVVCLASSGHKGSQVLFDDYNFEQPDSYAPFKGYGQSKTANVWTANYIDRVYGPRGVHAMSVHPGGILTGLQVHTSKEVIDGWRREPSIQKLTKSTEQGAATSIWAAVDKVWEGKGGEYLEDCSISDPANSGIVSGCATWVHDKESEDRLWKLSSKLVGLE